MKYSDLSKNQISAVCKSQSWTPSEIESYLESGDYILLTDAEADAAAAEYIRDSLWAFNASFLACETDLPEEIYTVLSKSCESSNNAILKLVEKTCGLSSFVESAVSADGRGHFLSSYDGDETEIGDLYLYRIN